MPTFLRLNLKTGESQWSLKVTKSGLSSIVEPFEINKGRVYVVSTDKRISCIDIETQDVLWNRVFKSSIRTGPCLVNKSVVCVGVGDTLYCISRKNGKVFPTRFRVAGNIEETPVLSGNALYFWRF